MESSRLLKLFELLAAPSNVLREQAVLQIAEVADSHSDETGPLLLNVRKFLQHTSWDARYAAAKTAGEIASVLVNNSNKSRDSIPAVTNGDKHQQQTLWNWALKFDLEKVLNSKFVLASSEGKEFEKSDGVDSVQQRRILNEQLGVSNPILNLKTEEFLSDDDIRSTSNISPHLGGALSANGGPVVKLPKIEADESEFESVYDYDSSSSTNYERQLTECKQTESVEKLFWFYNLLANDLYNPVWTIRHGASLGMMEIQKYLALARCGDVEYLRKIFGLSRRLFFVLAVDRFDDFISVHAVAPVRETCAQCVGAMLSLLPEAGKASLLEICVQFLSDLHNKPWQCIHAGLLVVKYSMPFVSVDVTDVVDSAKTAENLHQLLQCVISCIRFPNEEVIVAASQAIVSNLHIIERLSDGVWLSILRSTVWDVLLNSRYEISDDWACGLLNIVAQMPGGVRANFLYSARHISALSNFLDHPSSDVCSAAVKCLAVAADSALVDGHATMMSSWSEQGVLHILRMAFFRCLTSTDSKLCADIENLWTRLLTDAAPGDGISNSDSSVLLACPFFGQWLTSLMAADHYPLIDATLLGLTDTKPVLMGGPDVMGLDDYERLTAIISVKIRAARLLAFLAIRLFECKSGSPEDCKIRISSLESCLLFHLNSSSSVRKIVVCMLLVEWAKIKYVKNELFSQTPDCEFPFEFSALITQQLSSSTMFLHEEILPKFPELNSLCREFLSEFAHDRSAGFKTIVNLNDAVEFVRNFDHSEKWNFKKTKNTTEFQRKFAQFRNEFNAKFSSIREQSLRISCWFSAVAVRFALLGDKLNPIIVPLMDVVKSDSLLPMVTVACESLAMLLITIRNRIPSPVSKMLKNLIRLHCSNEKLTPPFSQEIETPNSVDDESQIFNFTNRISFESAVNSVDENTSAVKFSKSYVFDLFNSDSNLSFQEPEVASYNAGLVLSTLCKLSGENLPDLVPSLWDNINVNFEEESQDLVYALQVIETIFPFLHSALRTTLTRNRLKSLILKFISSKHSSIRHKVSRCVAKLALADMLFVANEILPRLLQCLADVRDESARLGATEAIFVMLEESRANFVGIASVVALKMLARMTDSFLCIRQMASRCFGSLVKLLSLEATTELPGLSDQLKSILNEQRHFLQLLAQPERLAQSELFQSIASKTSADLRSYQKDGVTWLLFLNRYNLHGILCDDMGLGKTLQTLCCLALSYRDDNVDDGGDTTDKDGFKKFSLIICPKTLVQHWVNETSRFFQPKILNALSVDKNWCTKTMDLGRSFQELTKTYNIFVVSYEFIRKNRFFDSIKFHYCILDEGHVIKNPKTLTAKSVMMIKSDYRLVLSGTPVQNNVLELWSLFEFLIPGYLGDRRQFQQHFGKPILSAREPKATSGETRAGQAALESLHKMVLPFVLRRRKADVLNELPPKIVQDYYCVLSPLQRKLYQDFSQNVLNKLIGDDGTQRNAFQILTYLRKLCDHPCLVLKPDHSLYEEIVSSLKDNYGCYHLDDISLSGKLVALRQLLIECGIGRLVDEEEENLDVPTVSAHRALIFCQFKSVVDLIAQYFDGNVCGSVCYLRLDGTVAPADRQSVADRFNTDPSIDALLLTTHVGGLGLNLTGADVVIFIDHDWNPAKDLQAMDRAHRIGQKRTVNVYRLITQETLEEKIMRLQFFKLQNADAIIGEQNRSLASMATDQLLDLLTMDSSSGETDSAKNRKLIERKRKGGGAKLASGSSGGSAVANKALVDLPSLWDQSQYEDAFDFNKFLKSMQ